jgi:thioesterase domain-containing protein
MSRDERMRQSARACGLLPAGEDASLEQVFEALMHRSQTLFEYRPVRAAGVVRLLRAEMPPKEALSPFPGYRDPDFGWSAFTELMVTAVPGQHHELLDRQFVAGVAAAVQEPAYCR